MALHVLARHVLTASVALSQPDLLHRERGAARAFLENLVRADLEAFVPRASEAVGPYRSDQHLIRERGVRHRYLSRPKH